MLDNPNFVDSNYVWHISLNNINNVSLLLNNINFDRLLHVSYYYFGFLHIPDEKCLILVDKNVFVVYL